MDPAEKILKRKTFIKAEMDKSLSQKQSEALWLASADRLTEILARYRTLPKGLRVHTYNYIFPAAAIYLTIKEAAGQEKAFAILENAAVSNAKPMGAQLAKLMKIPGMSSLFISVWKPLTKKMFGAGNGFQNVFYPNRKGEFRMDITACPYCRYFGELGCPELTKIFCENDDRIYGNLPGIKFTRTGTLGKGADRCDFYIQKQ